MAQEIPIATKILRRPRVEDRTGLSRSTIYAKICANEFPKPVRLGRRAVGWLESEIDAWVLAQIRQSRQNNARRP